MALRFTLKRDEMDMTSGGIARLVIRFAFPLLVGNLFQQLYNMVDSWVVGNYVSNEAFSAVGSVGPVINMLIGFFLGLSAGAGVVISQFYGAGRPDRVRDAVHTSILLTLLLAVVFTALGVTMTPLMLRLMNSPADVFPEARTYLTIYFSGVIGLMVYNMGSAILRAVGDSVRPFYYLVICALLNTGLDLLFVLVFQMGVAGVALATIISQFVSAVLVTVALLRSRLPVRLVPKKLRIDRSILFMIVKVGFPAAIQMALTSFSNVFVQSYINHFGSNGMSGWTAYAKIDALLFLPVQSIALAATTFVGQNLGKGQIPRARRGVRVCLGLALVSSLILMAPVMIFAPELVAFFNSRPEVVAYGTSLLRYISPFYVLPCVNQILSGGLRGAGNSTAPMIIMLSTFVLFRQIYLFVMTHYIANEFIPVALSYPAGWLACSIVLFLYYRRFDFAKTKLT